MASADPAALSAEELETAGRLVLADLPVTLRSGPWWGYQPAEAVVTYPAGVLSEWPADRLIAALSHEAAEARFTGPEGGRQVAAWVERLAIQGVGSGSLTLLVNVINDMRVNRLQTARYPSTARLFRALYRDVPALELKTDVRRSPDDEADPPFHHQYLDGLIQAWTQQQWPDEADEQPRRAARVRRALARTADAVARAAQKDEIADLLEAVEVHVLPTYTGLVREWHDEQVPSQRDQPRRPAPDASDPGKLVDDTSDEPAMDDPDPDSPTTDATSAVDAPPASSEAPEPDATATSTPPPPDEPEPADDAAGPPRRSRRAGAAEPDGERRRARASVREQVLASGGETWHRGLISAARADEPPSVDYERFDYVAATRRLAPLIRDSIEGDGRRPGLADIMNRRRYGSVDPWRRPRKHRSGDSGDIDVEHLDRLQTSPDHAFLKGMRVPRADRQRDFASAIVLDISGSMVQRGFPTRKYDRLVDAAVIFIEIHERLKIPYEVLSFSSDIHVHWPFDRCQWTTARIDSGTAYTPNDHSEVFRSMYRLDHRDTDDAGAVRAAARDTLRQDGLKSVLVVTDGISSDPSELRRVLTDIDRRNRNAPDEQRLKVLAFGVGVVRSEFESAYVPRADGKTLRWCHGDVVETTAELPSLIRNAIDERIRTA